MRIVFRVDSTTRTGTGHLGRCRTLGVAAMNAGHDVLVVTRGLGGTVEQRLEEAGFRVTNLPESTPGSCQAAGHAAWLKAPVEVDAMDTVAAVRETFPGGADWLVVDHYAIDIEWERILRGACARLMVIDDLADREHDADLLLDQTLGRDAGDYRDWVPAGTRLLCGPDYALLRPQFLELRDETIERRRTAPALRRTQISFGGVDRHNVTTKAIEAATRSGMQALDVVLGRDAPHRRSVRRRLVRFEGTGRLHVDTPNMPNLMAQADLAIGAGGVTSWERCVLGLPSIVVPVAANQRLVVRSLAEAGAAVVVEDDTNTVTELLDAVRSIRQNWPDRYLRMVDVAASICDGTGTARTLRTMEAIGPA